MNMLQSFDDVQDTFKAQGFHLDASSVLTNGLKPSLVDPSLLLEGILTTNPDDIQSVLNGNRLAEITLWHSVLHLHLAEEGYLGFLNIGFCIDLVLSLNLPSRCV